jgi:hypothetical protein
MLTWKAADRPPARGRRSRHGFKASEARTRADRALQILASKVSRGSTISGCFLTPCRGDLQGVEAQRPMLRATSSSAANPR